MSPEDKDYLSLRIDPELKTALRKVASKEGRSVGNLGKYLIGQHCENEGYFISENQGTYKTVKKK